MASALVKPDALGLGLYVLLDNTHLIGSPIDHILHIYNQHQVLSGGPSTLTGTAA